MSKYYKPKNTNIERIDQLNIVSKYLTSTFSKSESTHDFIPSSDIITVLLNHDKFIIHSDLEYIIKDIPPLIYNIREYIDSLYKCLDPIPPGSYISFIFNGVLGRTALLEIIDMFLKGKCKGILCQPYSLSLSMGLGIQHCIFVDEYNTHYNVYIVEDYVLHDCFTIKKDYNLKDNNQKDYNLKDNLDNNNKDYLQVNNKDFLVSVCLSDDQDYVEEYQKLRMTEDIEYYGCKICDYKSKEINNISEHIKTVHFINNDNKMGKPIFNKERSQIKNDIVKYKNNHKDLISEIISRIRFLYFNLDRLKRMNLRVVYTENLKINISDLCDQLKFLYNNVIPVLSDESYVYKGSELFKSLEISKECWISDKEWEAGRLRVLKDKILFNI
ncbi:actin-related protein [Vairimorpha necatrix]|uniref:Actin-related protein n=1 Tax=Vairimorpha necatrix TaxID=6039 RepID=A0AAX4JGS1_9MICR